jgi:hypothetical protein
MKSASIFARTDFVEVLHWVFCLCALAIVCAFSFIVQRVGCDEGLDAMMAEVREKLRNQ